MAQLNQWRVRISSDGRIVIPSVVRKQLGLDIGAEVILTIGADSLTFTSAKHTRHSVREKVRAFVGSGPSLSEELMAERKVEARRE
jgi:AbrB family looped-hinge helix DNA binding protein